jgi:hypothetical protein
MNPLVSVEGKLFGNDCEYVAAGEDQEIVALVRNFGAAVLAVENYVADFDVECEMLATVVAPAAWAYCENGSLLWLFLSGVRDDETGSGALFGFAWLDNNAVV